MLQPLLFFLLKQDLAFLFYHGAVVRNNRVVKESQGLRIWNRHGIGQFEGLPIEVVLIIVTSAQQRVKIGRNCFIGMVDKLDRLIFEHYAHRPPSTDRLRVNLVFLTTTGMIEIDPELVELLAFINLEFVVRSQLAQKWNEV